MPRKLTASTGVVLALVLGFAGCGGDDKKAASPSQNAATPPAAATTTTATGTGSKKGGKSSKIPTATSDAVPSATKKSGTSKASTKKQSTGKKSTGKAATKPKVTTKKKTKVPGVTPPSSGSGADLSSGTGSGPSAERLDVVGTLRRYYKAFIERDATTVCDLLTDSGQKLMIQDGNGKDCKDSAKRLMDQLSEENVTLLQRTRDGLHIDDVKVSGNDAVVQIGKTSTLKLVQQDGHWLVRSPNVEVSNS